MIGDCTVPAVDCASVGGVGAVGDTDEVMDGGTVVPEVSRGAPAPVAGAVLCAVDGGVAGSDGAAAAGAEVLGRGRGCGARMGTCTAPGGRARGVLVGAAEPGAAAVSCRGRPDAWARAGAAEPAGTVSLDELPAPEGARRDGPEPAALEEVSPELWAGLLESSGVFDGAALDDEGADDDGGKIGSATVGGGAGDAGATCAGV